jgi:hypothetical protein
MSPRSNTAITEPLAQRAERHPTTPGQPEQPSEVNWRLAHAPIINRLAWSERSSYPISVATTRRKRDKGEAIEAIWKR